MPGWDRQVFENVLLGFLVKQPAHGYQLAAHFEPGGDLEDIARLGRSQLYDLLKALERQGAALSSLREEGGGPARKVFSATAAGHDRFHVWLTRPVDSIRGLRIEFVFKLYFYRRLGLPGVADLLTAQAALLERRQAGLQQTTLSGDDLSAHLQALQRRLLDGALAWLREERRALERGGPGRPRGAAP